LVGWLVGLNFNPQTQTQTQYKYIEERATRYLLPSKGKAKVVVCALHAIKRISNVTVFCLERKNRKDRELFGGNQHLKDF